MSRDHQLRPHPGPDDFGNLDRRPKKVRAAGHIGKRLIDRDPLDQRGEIAEHGNRRIAEPLIFLEMPADEK